MTIWVEDTARNVLAVWASEACAQDSVEAAVLSPFCTPQQQDWKQSGSQTVERLREAGLEVWFDPETHALQMPAVGFFRYYQSWDLWSGTPGALGSQAEMRDHVRRVFAVQDELGVPHLAPTILLHSAQSATSQGALDLSRVAVDEDPECRLSIAGDATFWGGATLLDGHVGALAQLEPAGWFVTVSRQLGVVPVPAIPSEVYGLCRTARALSEGAPVHVSHGDLAGLPAIAAGGASLGTGWDVRQKVSAYSNYAAPDPDPDGGQWFSQATHQGLTSCLVRGDAQVLADRDAVLSSRLLPGTVPPGAKEAWLHHAAILNRLTDSLGLPYRDAYEALRGVYESAQVEWPVVAGVLGVASQADAWVTPLLAGLEAYGRTEGF
jgi:hypothetical protein